jgi:hypothetical protein
MLDLFLTFSLSKALNGFLVLLPNCAFLHDSASALLSVLRNSSIVGEHKDDFAVSWFPAILSSGLFSVLRKDLFLLRISGSLFYLLSNCWLCS